jgi:phospholipid/cholesterol/gamma-HCH transport system substrate-binding protein
MPRTRSLGWTELKIGILAVVAIAIATVVIFLVSGEGGFFWQRYTLKAKFDNVAGLKPGAPVRVAGVEVGTVKGVAFTGTDVDVTFQLSQDMQQLITTRSTALIGSVSLLGEASLDLTASKEGTPVPQYGYVPSRRTPGQLADVAESATKGLEQATQLIRDIRAGKGTVGRLFTDDALYKDVQGFVDAAESVAQNLRAGRGTAGKLLNDPSVYRNLEASLLNLQAITARLNAGEGSLGQLMNDPRFANSLSSTTANIDALTGRINRGEGTAGKLVTDPALYNRMNSVAERLEALTTRLNDGEGTAGQLLHDKQLYENLNSAANEMRGLVADIRKDPQKYLRVKVSIF